MPSFFTKRSVRTAAVAVSSLGLLAGIALVDADGAGAADVVGTLTSITPDASTTALNGEAIVWQGEILANRNYVAPSGYVAFTMAGAAAPSPIATVGVVKTSAIFGSLLTWISGTTVYTANPGGTVTALTGAVPATADSILAVGNDLWISRAGGVDRYTPTAAALGAGTALPGTFAATSILRMAVGPDNNVWVIEKNPGVDTLTRWTPAGAAVGAALNFPSSAADPIALALGSDGAMWVVEGGNNSVARIDGSFVLTELPLPAGAAPLMVANGPGGVWVTESGLNNVSRISFSAGSFTRLPFAAPSSFGLRSVVLGPDGNMWAVGSIANKMAKFGTTIPTTTTTTIATTTTAAPTTTVVATTAAPTTAAPTTAAPTAPPTTQAPAPATKKKVCIKSAKKKVKVGKKFVTQTVCTKYKLV